MSARGPVSPPPELACEDRFFDLVHAGSCPFFTPPVMTDRSLATWFPVCGQTGSDNDAIVRFGRGDPSDNDPTKRAPVLARWGD